MEPAFLLQPRPFFLFFTSTATPPLILICQAPWPTEALGGWKEEGRPTVNCRASVSKPSWANFWFKMAWSWQRTNLGDKTFRCDFIKHKVDPYNGMLRAILAWAELVVSVIQSLSFGGEPFWLKYAFFFHILKNYQSRNFLAQYYLIILPVKLLLTVSTAVYLKKRSPVPCFCPA